MSKSKVYIIIALSSLLFVACDCFTHKAGLILDAQTGEPVIGAKIKFDNYETQSDSNGYFKIHIATGFCPDWKFLITKDSYKPFELEMDMNGDYVDYKVKDEKKYFEYSKPKPHPFYKNSTLNGEWENLNSTEFTAVNKDSLIFKLEKTDSYKK